jgi:hypothetical protein
MPTYTFHFPSSPHLEPLEGQYEDLKAVRAEAALLAGELMKDQSVDFWRSPDRRLYVTDEEGQVVCTVRIIGTTGEP